MSDIIITKIGPPNLNQYMLLQFTFTVTYTCNYDCSFHSYISVSLSSYHKFDSIITSDWYTLFFVNHFFSFYFDNNITVNIDFNYYLTCIFLVIFPYLFIPLTLVFHFSATVTINFGWQYVCVLGQFPVVSNPFPNIIFFNH